MSRDLLGYHFSLGCEIRILEETRDRLAIKTRKVFVILKEMLELKLINMIYLLQIFGTNTATPKCVKANFTKVVAATVLSYSEPFVTIKGQNKQH